MSYRPVERGDPRPSGERQFAGAAKPPQVAARTVFDDIAAIDRDTSLIYSTALSVWDRDRHG
jgi:hypothetical protein